MKVVCLSFSPTGGTRKVGEALAQGMAQSLGGPVDIRSFNTPAARQDPFAGDPNTAYVIGFPVYAGRVPNLLREDVAKMVGHGAPVLAYVTYGNRSYGDGLSELAGLLEEGGFRLVGGVAAVCQHAFATSLAPGRPTDEDLAHYTDIGRQVGAKIAQKDFSRPTLPGAWPPGPYYVPKDPATGDPLPFLKIKVKTKDTCTDCGACVPACPLGSIPADNPRTLQGPCMKCQACLQVCPVGAKYFDDEAFFIHKDDLEATYPAPKDSEAYL